MDLDFRCLHRKFVKQHLKQGPTFLGTENQLLNLEVNQVECSVESALFSILDSWIQLSMFAPMKNDIGDLSGNCWASTASGEGLSNSSVGEVFVATK